MKTRNRVTAFVLVLITISFYISLNTYTPPRTIGVPLGSENQRGSTLNNDAAGILLVSAFFPLPKSKHTMGEYTAWLSHFLKPITTDVYLFTTPEMKSVILAVRGNLPITINTSFSSPFDIPPLSGRRRREEYVKMHALDREKRRHSPDLYAVWNGKPYYLDEAVKNAGKDYDYAFWCDAGSFRMEHKYVNWPDLGRVQEIWEKGSWKSGTSKEDLLFFPIWGVPPSSLKDWRGDMGPVDCEFSEGSFFGGSVQAIRWWRSFFFAYHDYYVSLGMFVGKDQTLINALLLLEPSRIITVWRRDPLAPGYGCCGGEWFYYQLWMAGSWEREEMCRGGGWWKSGERCWMATSLGMEEVLQRQFGVEWKPPKVRGSV